MRKKGFANIAKNSPLVFYSDKSGFDMISEIKTEGVIGDDDLQVRQIKLNTPFDVEGYSVVALRAAHADVTSPVVYLIEKNGKTIFYSNDTSEYPPESMDYLKTLKKPIDLISLDCTEACNNATYIGHLSLDRCIELRKTLLDIGAADKNTVFVLNHFSHNSKKVLYDDFVKIAAKLDFEVSYDGMVIEI